MKLAKTPADAVTTEKNAAQRSMKKEMSAGGQTDDQATLNLQLYGMIARKVERIVSVIENSHDTHGKMLRHSKA